VAIDPSFAPAYAGQADVYNLLPAGHTPFTAFPLAKEAAAKALSLDPTLGEAHTSLALAELLFDRDIQNAEIGFQRAIGLAPGYETAHQWYGELLAATGRFDEAFVQLEQARTLDPFSAPIHAAIGETHCYARRYDEGIAELRNSLSIDPNNASTY